MQYILYIDKFIASMVIPMAIEVSCFPISAAKSSTHPLASYPGTEHINAGVLAFICLQTNINSLNKNLLLLREYT